MTTYREAIYMCLDLVKGVTEDFSYTEEHIAYLLDKYRALLLKQHYGKDPKKHVPYSNYQTVEVPVSKEGNSIYFKSDTPIPTMMFLGIPRISTDDYYNTNFEFVSRERLPFVGNNKFIQNVCYVSINDSGFLCVKPYTTMLISEDEGLTLRLTAIFENPREVAYSNSMLEGIDVLDSFIPIEETLVSTLIEVVVKVLSNSTYKPEDLMNNDRDDLANLHSFLASNVKSDLAKQMS